MVALKPSRSGSKRTTRSTSRNAVVALKPELLIYFGQPPQQAGTPWWH